MASPEVETLYNPESRSIRTVNSLATAFMLCGSISSALPGQKRKASAVNAWYYTRDIDKESELLSQLQGKACFDQESIGWEFAVIGIQDITFYVRLATSWTSTWHSSPRVPSSCRSLWRTGDSKSYYTSNVEDSGHMQVHQFVYKTNPESALDLVHYETLTKAQQQTLVRLADWIVSDVVFNMQEQENAVE
ncbi:histidine kinase HHK3 [Penicillium canescens]|nr:histidine kinase HHK3 [Penicillium canescens]